jgi:TPP-dependent pyruvate/acetoin dehydrogenase alpha subunit
MGDHSTSDNSALYRSEDERKYWREKNNPITRLTKFLASQQYKNLVDE